LSRMTLVSRNDVELQQDQEPLVPDDASLPAKPWSRRMVVVAITVGVVAILGTLAILKTGASGHDANMNHNAHTQLLKRYTHTLNAPLRHLRDLPNVNNAECKKAFKAHLEKAIARTVPLVMKAMDECFQDQESDTCKDATKKLEEEKKKIKDECKDSGDLCDITIKHKDGEIEDEDCIPKECHAEVDKINEWEMHEINHDDDVKECQDGKCKVELTCAPA